MNYDELLNIKRHIYYVSMSEPEEGALRFIVERCGLTKERKKEVSTLEVDESLPLLQIDFEFYAAYNVINESFSFQDKYERFQGNAFRIYQRSHYLDFLKKNSTAFSGFMDGPLVHYELACLDFIIDVASFEKPTVSEIERE